MWPDGSTATTRALINLGSKISPPDTGGQHSMKWAWMKKQVSCQLGEEGWLQIQTLQIICFANAILTHKVVSLMGHLLIRGKIPAFAVLRMKLPLSQDNSFKKVIITEWDVLNHESMPEFSVN